MKPRDFLRPAALPIAWLTIGIVTGCADAETRQETEPAAPAATERAAANPFAADRPLPSDQVFFPEADAADGKLHFRIQVLPGYYVYEDWIAVRSLDESITLGEVEYLTTADTVSDEWFGEQSVFYLEASGITPLDAGDPPPASFDIELSYRGCKTDEICYAPVTRVLTVALGSSPQQ